jgi:hypothetical protein
MAVHQDLWTLAEEAIDEYLIAADKCVKFHKPDGGCLGVPAALLLLCVVNALGTYLRDEIVNIGGKVQPITKREPFRVLNHPLLGQNLSTAQIKRVEHAYRNALAHEALMWPGHWLTPAPAIPPFGFQGEQISISVPSLYAAVERAWRNFDKSKIKGSIEKFRLAGIEKFRVRKPRPVS